MDQLRRVDPVLSDAAREARCVFVAGLPGAGKSSLVRRAAALAARLGRTVHLLQWDVARLPFDRADVLARYPEVNGVTHAAIRLAVGRWARAAVRDWDERHDRSHLIIGETPLVGERLASLARPAEDAVEPLLASEATLFLVPVPTPEVRRAIEGARARDVSDAGRERDLTSAPPQLVQWHWDDLVRVGRALAVTDAPDGSAYDPSLYARVYERLLRHRHVRIATIDEIVDDPRASDVVAASELVPTAAEVDAAMAEVERVPSSEVARLARDWYLP